MKENQYHLPVLTDEIVSSINLKRGGVYVDCTVGGGGHSFALLSKMPCIRLFCIDQDEDAIRYAKKRLHEYQSQTTFIMDNFKNLKTILALHKINKVDGIIMDIGVSNHQIQNSNRGFSYTQDGPLDMRMDRAMPTNAYDIINNYSEENLIKIFYEYGQESNSKRIVKNILKKRENETIKTTAELAEIVNQSVSGIDRKDITKIKARIFQALRIEINAELDVLNIGLQDAITLLNVGARILIISWHSLEDKIVKDTFRRLSGQCVCPVELPVCSCNTKKKLKIVTKKPITPTDEEVMNNSNAKSARLRIAERVA
jgi:16S rRNA (cytosine1402-N4)-methyltransferase